MINDRQLDALIAEKVMGYENKGSYFIHPDKPGKTFVLELKNQPMSWGGGGWQDFLLPKFSESIEEAFQVVEQITRNKWIAFKITARPYMAAKETAWQNGYKFEVSVTYGGQTPFPGPQFNSSSLPHAICLAAARTIEDESK